MTELRPNSLSLLYQACLRTRILYHCLRILTVKPNLMCFIKLKQESYEVQHIIFLQSGWYITPSLLSPPQRLLQRRNGEKIEKSERKRGNLKIGGTGGSVPQPPRAFSPIPQPTGKNKSGGGESLRQMPNGFGN